jgi:rhamnulokinase
MHSSDSNKAYLAFDFGAESGRAVLGRLNSGILSIQEIHRFANEPVEYGGSLHWDAPRLWWEVRKAFRGLEAQELHGIGVDAWGVDYALIGERGELLQNPFHYRDARTVGVMDEIFRMVSKADIYKTTGIQFMQINTLYQLFAAQRDTPQLLRAARYLLTMPDLFHYWLTGNAVCEQTIASTTQLVDVSTRTWATGLMDQVGLPSHLPAPVVEPGSILGYLKSGLGHHTALAGVPVIAPASHDTASAVAAVRGREDTAFLSSGTWSLVGIELDRPIVTPEAMRLNFTNEGGVNGTTRFLKNVMGLWMLQCCRQSWCGRGRDYSYPELIESCEQQPAFAHLVDPDDASFLRPDDMCSAIDRFCAKTGQPSPQTPGAYARTVLESLALKYRLVIRNLERLTGKTIRQVRVIGGGSKNRVLNQFTADATGKKVLAGPAEATALGNLGVQILATGGANSLEEVRGMIDRSFPTELFEPQERDKWDCEAERFEQYCEVVCA